MAEPIRVFVSYSGDDWESFVKPFATQLLENGINAVVANWDIHPGESLVQRIFNEEIPHAHAIVIVLSMSSVSKPWVIEELDHATVRRIEDRITLIPLRIDDCDVPDSLRTIKRISIHNEEERDVKIREVIDTIYGRSQKPPLGQSPSYIRASWTIYPEISDLESQVLNAICSTAMEKGRYSMRYHEFTTQLDGQIEEDQTVRALKRLTARGLIQAQATMGNNFHRVELSHGVAADYCREVFPSFVELQQQIGADAGDAPPNSMTRFSCPDGIPEFVFLCAIDDLVRRGWFRAQWTWDADAFVTHVSPFIDEWIDQL